MNWFLFALIGPLLYATTNQIDKILLEKYLKSGGVGTLMLFSSLLSALALPFIFLADPEVFHASATSILVLAIVGILNVAVLWFYFLALKDNEASVVVVFYQLVPVFGYILGHYILQEDLREMQVVAMFTIILGTTIISFEINENNRLKIRHKTVFYMLIASFCWALGSVIFKAVALEENVLVSLFWEHLMLTFAGILIFVFVRSYRRCFFIALRNNPKKIISINFLNEALYISGSIVFSFSYMLAPISLVLLANSFQSIFVLVIGIFLNSIFPNACIEKVQAKHIGQKIMAICISGVGTYLLFIS